MNRRSFIKGLFATGVVSAVAPKVDLLAQLAQAAPSSQLPRWVGTSSSETAAPLTYEMLERMYTSCLNAPDQPDMIVMSKRCAESVAKHLGMSLSDFINFDDPAITYHPLTYKEL